MKRAILLVLMMVMVSVLRFYRLDSVPPVLHSSSLLPRLVTAFISLINVFLTYKLSAQYSSRLKIGLLSAFIMGVLPWTLEESRLYSSVNNGLTVLLSGIYVGSKFRVKWQSLLIALISITAFTAVYHDIWYLKGFRLIGIEKFRDNLFELLSPQMWFFHNITFYHGGLREWGLVFISLLPFLIYGIFKPFTKVHRNIIVILGGLIVCSSLSPFFPESREFFLATPLLSFLIGSGIYGIYALTKLKGKLMLAVLTIFFLYEISQLLHFYYIHYPINVRDSADKIYEPF